MRPLTLLCVCEVFLTIPSMTFAGPFSVDVPAGVWRSVSCNLVIHSYGPWTGVLLLYTNRFTAFVNDDDPGPGWNPSTPVIPRGGGAFIRPYEPATIRYSDAIAPPTLPLDLPALSLVSCQSNVVATFEGIVGRAPVDGTRVHRYNPGPGRDPLDIGQPPDYSTYTYSGGEWSPCEPVVDLGEAVWVDQPTAFVYQPKLLNPRLVSGQFTFEVETVYGYGTKVEYANTLPSDSWKELMAFTGDGYRKTATDTNVPNASRRFYRIQTVHP